MGCMCVTSGVWEDEVWGACVSLVECERMRYGVHVCH